MMKYVAIALLASLAAMYVPAADARSATSGAAAIAAPAISGNVEAGRTVALEACTGCHVVAPNQPFAPVFTGPPPPPDFRAIANHADATARSLRRHLALLPAVPPPGKMANPDLTDEDLTNVVAYIMSLKEGH